MSRIFNLTVLSKAAIEVEAYKVQTGLTNCYFYQHFGHI
jgi:hypothetical protein